MSQCVTTPLTGWAIFISKGVEGVGVDYSAFKFKYSFNLMEAASLIYGIDYRLKGEGHDSRWPYIVDFEKAAPIFDGLCGDANYSLKVLNSIIEAERIYQIVDYVKDGFLITWELALSLTPMLERDESNQLQMAAIPDRTMILLIRSVREILQRYANNVGFNDQRHICNGLFHKKNLHLWLAKNNLKTESRYNFETGEFNPIEQPHEAIRNAPSEHPSKPEAAAPKTNPKTKNKQNQIIAGLALAQYAYDRNAGRQEATQQIIDDLAVVGVSVDAKTIRRYIQDGLKQIPIQKET